MTTPLDEAYRTCPPGTVVWKQFPPGNPLAYEVVCYPMIVCQDVHVATITASDAIAGRFKFPEPVTGVNINEFARVQTPDDFKLRFFECFDEDANQVRFYAQLATETCQHLGWVGRDGLHNPWNPTA